MTDAEVVGRLVRFTVATLHGLGKMAGTVIGVLPDGRLDIRAQQGGYYQRSLAEVEVRSPERAS